MIGNSNPIQNYMPNAVSQRIIQQALHDMKQQLIHQLSKQTQPILNTLLTNISAKINTQLTELFQQIRHLKLKLSQSQIEYQKMAGNVQHLLDENEHLLDENEHLRSQLELISNKSYQYLEEMNISKNQLYQQKSLTFYQQLQKMELQKKVIYYQQKIEEIQTQINSVTHLYEKEKERNQELELLLKSLDQNLKQINQKYDQQHGKNEQMSSNLSQKEGKIKLLQLIIEQSEYLNNMSPKTREKYNFRVSQTNNQSLQDNQFQYSMQQRVKLYQSGYRLPRQLLFQMSYQEKKDLSKEGNAKKKMKEMTIKKVSIKKVQQESPLPTKELTTVKKPEILSKKNESDEKEKECFQMRKRLNTIFKDRVKYRVELDVKMQSLRSKLNQKQKQCEKLNKLLRSKSTDKNNSSFLKKSFQKSRTLSKNSQKEIKNLQKEQSSKRIKERIKRSAPQILSEASQLSNSKLIQNFQQFEVECMEKSHSKKQDQFQEFGLSPDKMRHHYLNCEIDMQGDISFKMLHRDLDQSAELSSMEIRSRGNESILDSSLQFHTVEINNSNSNICKMDSIKQVEEVRSPNSPINLNQFSQGLNGFDLNKGSDEQINENCVSNKSDQKVQAIQIWQPQKLIQNRVSEYEVLYRVQHQQIKESRNVHTQTVQIQNNYVQIQTQIEENTLKGEINPKVIQEVEIFKRIQLHIEHIISIQIQPSFPISLTQSHTLQLESRILQLQIRIQQPKQTIVPEEPVPKNIQNKETQHQSKFSLQTLDSIKIQPLQIQQRPLGIFKQLNYRIEKQKLRNMRHSSLCQVFRFEGLKVSTLSVSVNTNQQNLALSTKIISEMVIAPSQIHPKTAQEPLNTSNIRKAFSIEVRQNEPLNQLPQSLASQEPPSIPITQQKHQVKECKDQTFTQPVNSIPIEIKSVDLVQSSQKNPPHTDSLKQQRVRFQRSRKRFKLMGLCKYKEKINKKADQKQSGHTKIEQKQSDNSKNSPMASQIVIKPQKQKNQYSKVLKSGENNSDKVQVNINAKPPTEMNIILQTPVSCKHNHNQTLNQNTAHSCETSTIKDTPLAEKIQPPKNPTLTPSDEKIIKSKFYTMKSYQQILQVSFQTPPEIQEIFAQYKNMFVFSAHKNNIPCKFILWKGKLIHIADKVSYMYMNQYKQLRVKPPNNYLILGNCQFTFLRNKLAIQQANKLKKFIGIMPQGEWIVSKVTIYKTDTGR